MKNVWVDIDGPEQAIIEACDEIHIVGCFAKTHRPEEKAKIASAKEKLRKLKSEHPDAWETVAKFNRREIMISYR